MKLNKPYYLTFKRSSRRCKLHQLAAVGCCKTERPVTNFSSRSSHDQLLYVHKTNREGISEAGFNNYAM